MGLRERVQGLFGGRHATIQQAEGTRTSTPRPANLDDLGMPQGDINSIFQVRVPDPEHISMLIMVSHEVASTIKTIRRQVWRRPLKIVPSYALKCLNPLCGHETDNAHVAECPGCGGPRDNMVEPDEDGKHILETWQREVNLDGDHLEELGEQLEDDGNAHDNLYVVFRFEHELNEMGAIVSSVLQEARRGDPRVMRQVRDNRGRLGGKMWVCMRCRRNGAKYRPEPKPQPCDACGAVTYECCYVEVDAPTSGNIVAYYIRSEVVDKTLHYGGSSPLARLWDKAVAILWMDKMVTYAFDPRRDKRADTLLIVIGSTPESIEKWAKKDANERRRNPYRQSTLHLPINGAGAEARPDAKVLDLGPSEFKGQSPEIYTRNVRAIWREYGITPAIQGDLTDAGGLNNEGLQLRVTAGNVEHHQRQHRDWTDRLCEAVGVSAWHYEFEEVLEEQEQLDADTLTKLLDVADKAASLGLEVRWHDDKPVISDGIVKAKSPSIPPGLMPPGANAAPDAQETADPGSDATGDDPAGRDSASRASADARVEMSNRAPTNSDDVPAAVRRVLRPKIGDPALAPGQPSGAAAAADAAYEDAFAGLTAQQSDRVKSEIVASLTQPQGWSIGSIKRRIQPILQGAGVANPDARAELIARMETSAIVSEWKLRVLRTSEEERGTQDRYVVVGADDFRTTKLSRWIRAQVGDGKPLDDVLRVIDHGILLAKQGSFTETGALSGVEGEPIRLPADFTRRGTIAHFGERDIVVRKVGGGD